MELSQEWNEGIKERNIANERDAICPGLYEAQAVGKHIAGTICGERFAEGVFYCKGVYSKTQFHDQWSIQFQAANRS